MKLEVALLGTDTQHRRYIIQRLIDFGINLSTCIFETNWGVRGRGEILDMVGLILVDYEPEWSYLTLIHPTVHDFV